MRRRVLSLVEGRCFESEILFSSIGLSFWGQVDALSGEVIGEQHPLRGKSMRKKILAIPSGVGSCTGSQVLLELILNGNAPVGIITSRPDPILAISSVVASEIFDMPPIPIVATNDDSLFETLDTYETARVQNNRIVLNGGQEEIECDKIAECLELQEKDLRVLNGESGEAARDAMRIVTSIARLQGASKLIDVKSVHIDSTIFIGDAGLRYVRHFVDLEENSSVCVPTTTNSGSVDRRAWREMGIKPSFGVSAERLGDSYLELGCKPSFTCAPYLLPSARPNVGDDVCWGESNAVVFANSVCGAKTQKCGDFLDLAVAMTGRAPYVSTHIEENRRASLVLDVPKEIMNRSKDDDAFYAVLGFLAGRISNGRVPLVKGLDQNYISEDRLKSFSAAFGTSGSVSMFHMDGITPESSSQIDCKDSVMITESMLRGVWYELNSCDHDDDDDDDDRVDLVALGNPHFSLSEIEELKSLCENKRAHSNVSVVVTTAREILDAASQSTLSSLNAFGVKFVTDTCWCMLSEPVIPIDPEAVIMTNSAKYAHYGPGLVNRNFRFGNLNACVDVSVCGKYSNKKVVPDWIFK